MIASTIASTNSITNTTQSFHLAQASNLTKPEKHDNFILSPGHLQSQLTASNLNVSPTVAETCANFNASNATTSSTFSVASLLLSKKSIMTE